MKPILSFSWVGCIIVFLWFLYAQPPVAAGLKTAFAWHKAQGFYWSSHEFCMRGQPSFPTVCSLTAHSKETKEVCLVTHHISPGVWTLFIRAGRKTIWTSDTVQTLLGLSQDSAGVFKSVQTKKWLLILSQVFVHIFSFCIIIFRMFYYLFKVLKEHSVSTQPEIPAQIFDIANIEG